MGLFKTKFHPITKVELTNANCKFVNSQLGSDSSLGTREDPFATLTKAISVGGNSIILAYGVFNENYTGNVIADDMGLLYINGNIILTSTSPNYILYGAIISGNFNFGNSYEAKKLIIKGIATVAAQAYAEAFNDNFAQIINFYSTNILFSKNTIANFKNYVNAGVAYNRTVSLTDSVFIESIDLYNYSSRSNVTYYPVFKNCLFRKATLWKWNGATTTINWTNNPVGGAAYTTEPLMQRVYNSLLYYANNTVTAGTDRTYAQAILATQATMFQDCVVYDDTDTVNNPIFSRYVGGVPVDYTLALKSNNPALYMSTTGSYVGCYAANVNDDGSGNALTFGVVKHVDTTTGADTSTTPDLLIQDGSNPAKFSASQSSTQLWNRIRTGVVSYPRGKSFAGMQSQLDSGIASRLFFGKRQEIRTTGDITQKTTAFESVEVIPYDSIPASNNTTQNTINNMSALIPRFSAPFNGECLMFYKGGVPLLFNALLNLFQGAGTVSITSGSPTVTGTGTAFIADFVAGDNIRINGVDYTVLTTPTSNTSLTLTANVAATLSGQSYYVGVKTDKSTAIYGTWAVTNADIESYSLLQKATKAGITTSIPLIKYAKFELNLHYDEE